MRERQSKEANCAADMLDIALDTYLREQDMTGLKVDDVMDDLDMDVTILKFGRSDRGESSKTGRNQGVRLDWPWSRRILRERCRGRKPHQK
eukprot:4432023-Heterocapsa_arctica.AAC.1